MGFADRKRSPPGNHTASSLRQFALAGEQTIQRGHDRKAASLPRFAGMRPYDHVPFEWSVHRQERTGATMKRYDFLAESASDPRIPFLESLCQAVKAAGS